MGLLACMIIESGVWPKPDRPNPQVITNANRRRNLMMCAKVKQDKARSPFAPVGCTNFKIGESLTFSLYFNVLQGFFQKYKRQKNHLFHPMTFEALTTEQELHIQSLITYQRRTLGRPALLPDTSPFLCKYLPITPRFRYLVL